MTDIQDTPHHLDDVMMAPHHLDDVMMAMDVVDTIRHDRALVARDMANVERREDLIDRLRGIYKAQGIEVPDSVLMDGVMALENERFAYHPPKPGLSTRLAKLYIGRRKWLPLFYTLAFIIGSVSAVNYVGFVRPAQMDAAKTERLLTQDFPAQLSAAHDKAKDLAATEALKSRADDLYALGQSAISDRDIGQAKTTVAALENFARTLGQSYTMRIVSRYNEASGVYLDSRDDASVQNFYLIVEAIDAADNVLSVDIEDEDYQKVERVTKFGVRVPQSVFNRVAADKKDDQIIQDDILGVKKRGMDLPELTISGAENFATGFITEW